MEDLMLQPAPLIFICILLSLFTSAVCCIYEPSSNEAVDLQTGHLTIEFAMASVNAAIFLDSWPFRVKRNINASYRRRMHFDSVQIKLCYRATKIPQLTKDLHEYFAESCK